MEKRCHGAGPQLRAGFALGSAQHHLRLCHRHLHLYSIQLPAGSVKGHPQCVSQKHLFFCETQNDND